ncbi:MAG: NAD(P)-dependent oxidoreductase [Amphritea sp.]|nr:NAD(P)-dependent oxidoreductase [Amphritea sp.]
MANIAFFGLGNMGLGIARNLLRAGHQLTVYNRTPEKARTLLDDGATLATTPAEAAQNADFLIAMLSDDHASRSIWLGPEGALDAAPKGSLIIECSTLSHNWVTELCQETQQRGLSYLDCPVTGLPDAAAAGQLTLFLGGPSATIKKAQPLFDAISVKQLHFGDIGSGTAYKLIVNLMGSIQIAATAEAMRIAEQSGLDLNLVSSALATGAASSPNVIRICEQICLGQDPEQIPFNARLRHKDTEYGAAFARQMDAPSLLGDVAEQYFRDMTDVGMGDRAEGALIEQLRSKS